MSGRLLGVINAWDLTNAERRQLAAWVQTLGVDPRDTYRIELRDDARLVARVYQWDRNEDGRNYCPRDHAHNMNECVLASRDVDVTIISAAGLDAIRDRMRAWADAVRHLCVALAPIVAVIRAHRSAMRAEYHRRRRNRRRTR